MDGNLWNRWEYFTWIGFRDVNKDGSLSNQQNVQSGVSGFKYSDALNEIEGILIEVIEPKLNKQAGRLKAASEYFQIIDPRMNEITTHDINIEIKKLNSKLDDFISAKKLN